MQTYCKNRKKKLWSMGQLTLEGRITVIKSLAVPKVIHLLLITKIHNSTIDLLYKRSWVKRLFEDNFHDWKVIQLFLIGKHLGKNFKFRNNIDLNNNLLSKFPIFIKIFS